MRKEGYNWSYSWNYAGDWYLLTLIFARVLEVVNVHVRTKFCQNFSGSWVIVLTKTKTNKQANKT